MTMKLLYRSSSSSEDEGSDAEANTEKLISKALAAVDEKDSQGICKSCNGDYYKNKIGRTEMLIHCAKCDSASKILRIYYRN